MYQVFDNKGNPVAVFRSYKAAKSYALACGFSALTIMRKA